MSGHILKFNKKRKISAPVASTAIPKAVHDPKEPVLETTLMEAVAVRKFIQFQLDDVHYQLSELAKTKNLRPSEFKEAKYTAEILASYLLNTLVALDARLSVLPSEGNA